MFTFIPRFAYESIATKTTACVTIMASPMVKHPGIHRKMAKRATKYSNTLMDTHIISTSVMKKGHKPHITK